MATAAERPELLGPAWDRTRDTLPEYNNHGDILNEYWPRLTEERPDFQFHLTGDEDEILARARSIPLRWDGTVEDLPAGIDGAIARGFDEAGANVLCALVIMVPRDIQGQGVSAAAVRAMGDIARRHGLHTLIAPVRPTWKERYPLVPIERYARWRRPDGWLFDPWMRVHERIGAAVLKPEPLSLRITGTITEWEDWTGMAFPDSGDYWFPGGLATVHRSRSRTASSYWERSRVLTASGPGGTRSSPSRKTWAAREAARSDRSAASSPSSTMWPGTTSRQDASAGKQPSGPACKACATAASSSRPPTPASSPRRCSPPCKAACCSPRSNGTPGRSPRPWT